MEGKGQLTNNLCLSKDPEKTLDVRYCGGPQAGHNVKHNEILHCFSNFGSGTLLQVPTYWSQYCLLDPFTSELERTKLRGYGIEPSIIYSPLCELITPLDVWYQRQNSQNREHGTVGVGIKSALDRIKNGYHLTILDALDLLVLREKLKSIQDNYYGFTGLTTNETNLNKWACFINKYVESVEIKAFPEIVWDYENIVFEGSQGILLDQTYGVMPWCTPSDVTSKNALKLIEEVGLETSFIDFFYVTRPYITRHGPGPLLCDSEVLNIEDPNNQYNEYQKSFRSCKLSPDLLMHSLRIDSMANKHYKYNTRKQIVFSHGLELDSELEKAVKNKTGLDILKFEYETWL